MKVLYILVSFLCWRTVIITWKQKFEIIMTGLDIEIIAWCDVTKSLVLFFRMVFVVTRTTTSVWMTTSVPRHLYAARLIAKTRLAPTSVVALMVTPSTLVSVFVFRCVDRVPSVRFKAFLIIQSHLHKCSWNTFVWNITNILKYVLYEVICLECRK